MIFDVESHEYSEGGRIYPSVTQILSAVGLIDDSWFNSESAARGRLIHEFTEAVDADAFSSNMMHPEYKGYVIAYERFKKESGFVVGKIELQMLSTDLCFAGTLDRTGELKDKNVIIDIKTGMPAKWHSVQLAGYQLLIKNNAMDLYSLYLNADGKYRLIKYKDTTRERNIFLSALNIYKWKAK